MSIDAKSGRPEQDGIFGLSTSGLATGCGRFFGDVKSMITSLDFFGFPKLLNLYAVGGVSLAGLPRLEPEVIATLDESGEL